MTERDDIETALRQLMTPAGTEFQNNAAYLKRVVMAITYLQGCVDDCLSEGTQEEEDLTYEKIRDAVRDGIRQSRSSARIAVTSASEYTTLLARHAHAS